MGWHSSVIIRISHDPVKEKYPFSQQQWSAVSHSATITGPSRDNLSLCVWVLEHLRTLGWGWQRAPEKEARRPRHLWTRPGQGVHLLALPSWPVPATTEEFVLGEGEPKLDALLGHHSCPALRVALLTTDTSGLKSLWSAVGKNCFEFPALLFIS